MLVTIFQKYQSETLKSESFPDLSKKEQEKLQFIYEDCNSKWHEGVDLLNSLSIDDHRYVKIIFIFYSAEEAFYMHVRTILIIYLIFIT